jgi:hypothetical protein
VAPFSWQRHTQAVCAAGVLQLPAVYVSLSLSSCRQLARKQSQLCAESYRPHHEEVLQRDSTSAVGRKLRSRPLRCEKIIIQQQKFTRSVTLLACRARKYIHPRLLACRLLHGASRFSFFVSARQNKQTAPNQHLVAICTLINSAQSLG